ncbi:MAG: primosomal protein N' [Raoultibacter sp.]
MRLASVILDIPTQSLDCAYSYAVADDMFSIEIGCAVLVPFGHRQAIGYVVAVDEVGDELPKGLDAAKLKQVASVLGPPYFNAEGAACAHFLSERYIAPLSVCVRLFTPPGGVPRMVHNGRYWQVEQPSVGAVDDRWVRLAVPAADFVPKKSAVKQVAIIEALRAGELRVAELTMEFGSVSAVLKTLVAKGVVVVEARRRMRGVDGVGATDGLRAAGSGTASACTPAFTPSPKPQLTEGQSAALATIAAACDAHCGEVVVLDGVTGSGKTEVYLQAIERTLADGRGAIVLVPEISLTPQTVARFRGRFGDTVAVMHSRMSQGERYDQWDLIRCGAARVVVGARSALFTPLADVGLIVIDEEHEGSYKQDSAPRYDARVVAQWMVARHQAALILGSATPSIESLYACDKNAGWHSALLPQRANKKPLPPIDVIDMANEFGGGHRSMFSRKLTTALLSTMDAGHKAVLLLNQRGFAQFLLCRECGFVPECPSCATSLTYHEQGAALTCHHCGHTEAVPPRCPTCNSPYLKKFGAGTQRVESELRALLEETGAHIVRMDADTTKGKGAHQRLLEEFAAADAAVLLGTQMIAKGLDFDEVTLVGVINADTMLKLPDFRAAERTFDLIEQVAGRAGRADLPGRVMVQTYWSQAAPIQAAAHYNRAAFLRDELPKRRLLGYPPYVRLANVLIWGKNEDEVAGVGGELSQDITRLIRDVVGSAWSVLPATPCVMAKLRGSYRYHIVVKAPLTDDISALLLPLFRRRKPHKTVNVAVDIDPSDLL